MLYYLPIGKIRIKGEYEKSEQSPTPSPTATATATPAPTPQSTTEDKTAKIAGTIASFAAQAGDKKAGATLTPPPQPFYFSFDPAKRGDVTFVTGQLRQRGIVSP